MYRVLANTPLPDSEDGFLEDTKMYFPILYDLKYMKEEFDDLKGGLSRVGDVLCVDRYGQQHQAGSDSWVTGLAYFKLMELYLHGINVEEEFNNVLFGLGKSKNEEYYLDQYAIKTEQLSGAEFNNRQRMLTPNSQNISLLPQGQDYSTQNQDYFAQPYMRQIRQDYPHMDEHYVQYDQYPQYNPYYAVNHHAMDYQNDNFVPGKDGYAFYQGSPNHIDYVEDDYHPMSMPFPMQYQPHAGD